MPMAIRVTGTRRRFENPVLKHLRWSQKQLTVFSSILNVCVGFECISELTILQKQKEFAKIIAYIHASLRMMERWKSDQSKQKGIRKVLPGPIGELRYPERYIFITKLTI